MEKNTTPPTCIVNNSHLKCFDYLTEKDNQLIDAHKVDIKYKKGEIIAKQGAFASHVIFLRDGLAKVYLEGYQRDLILKIISPNHLISLSSIIEGNNTFIYSAATYLDSKATLIDIDVFKQVIRNNAQFAAQIIQLLNANTAQIYGRFYCLTRKQSHGRVADILICLSQNVYKQPEFNLPVSRNDLGDLTGLSVESVIRIFKKFKEDKLIDVSGKTFKILDFERLMKISTFG